jgi:hypothetical protein
MQAEGPSRMTRVYRPERDAEVQQAANRVERDLATRAGAEMLAAAVAIAALLLLRE